MFLPLILSMLNWNSEIWIVVCPTYLISSRVVLSLEATMGTCNPESSRDDYVVCGRNTPQVDGQRPQPTRPCETHPPVRTHSSPGCLLLWGSVPDLSWPTCQVVARAVVRLDSGQVSPPGPPGSCAHWILNRMRLHSDTALRSLLSLTDIPDTINSIIVPCRMYSATHLLSHPDVQSHAWAREASFYSLCRHPHSSTSHFLGTRSRSYNRWWLWWMMWQSVKSWLHLIVRHAVIFWSCKIKC